MRCRSFPEHGVRDISIYKWKAKIRRHGRSEARRLKALEDQNTKLKRILVDVMLESAASEDFGEAAVMPAAKRNAVADLMSQHEMSEWRHVIVAKAQHASADAGLSGFSRGLSRVLKAMCTSMT